MKDKPVKGRRGVIFKRISVSMVVILILFSCVFLYTSYSTQKRQLIDLKKSLGISLTTSLRDTIDFATLLNPLSLERIVDHYGGTEGVDEILIMDSNFEIQASKFKDRIGKIWSDPIIDELNGAEDVISTQGGGSLTFATPIMEGKEKIGYAVITLSTLKENQAIYIFLFRMIILTILALGACVFLSVWIARRISDPVYKLKEGADLISRGELDLKIDIESNDEIGDLAGSFNQMAANLKKSYADIKREKENILETIRLFSKVLGKVIAGEKGASIDIEKLHDETKLLGEGINSLIAFIGLYTNDLETIKEESTSALSYIESSLERIVNENDYSVRIDVEKLRGEYKPIGTYINRLMDISQRTKGQGKKNG